MKKTFVTLFVYIALSFSLRADIIYPDGHAPKQEPFQLKKLSRGVANVFLAGFEVPKGITDTGLEEGTFGVEQFTLGLPRGIHKMFLRFGSGLYDLTTVGENTPPLWHVEPAYMGPRDLIPGYNNQFIWETIDTPAYRNDTFDSPSWH